MRAEFLTGSPAMSSQTMLIVRPRRQKSRMIKLLSPPLPPDEKTIRRLNALASELPFCRLHRVKKHDTL
ncbi:MAG TPA: hypothetical protein VKR41_11490 [Puia sp.]|nr:hypothetical protein [Puia sp.]